MQQRLQKLLAAAAKFFADQKFDLKVLMRAILQSETYQRASTPLPENAADAREGFDIARDSNPSRSREKNRLCRAVLQENRFRRNAAALQNLSVLRVLRGKNHTRRSIFSYER